MNNKRIKLEDLIYVSYYKIPKDLVKNDSFKNISTGAKMLYGVMVDRTELSKENGWLNENGEIFIYYKIEEIQKDLNITNKTAIKYINELVKNGLLEKENKDFNKPNKYYLLSIVEKVHKGSVIITPQLCNNYTSIVEKVHTNKNEYNNTEYNNIKKEKYKKEKKETKRLYFTNENVNEIFIEFLQMREKLKAVNSERAINILINKLNKYNDDVKIEMIENSITNSWKGIFELKNSYKQKEEPPEWFDKKIDEKTTTKEELEELQNLLKEFKEEQ